MLRRDLLSLGTLLAAGGLASVLPDVAGAKADTKPGLLAKGVKGTWKGKGDGSGTLTADVLVQSFAVETGRTNSGYRGGSRARAAPAASRPS